MSKQGLYHTNMVAFADKEDVCDYQQRISALDIIYILKLKYICKISSRSKTWQNFASAHCGEKKGFRFPI